MTKLAARVDIIIPGADGAPPKLHVAADVSEAFAFQTVEAVLKEVKRQLGSVIWAIGPISNK